jgi:hypothetical protein
MDGRTAQLIVAWPRTGTGQAVAPPRPEAPGPPGPGWLLATSSFRQAADAERARRQAVTWTRRPLRAV